MRYEEALHAFAERKIEESHKLYGEDFKIIRIIEVKVDMEQSVCDSYWGNENAYVKIDVKFEYDHTFLKSGKTKRKIGWQTFTYENPIDLLKELLNDKED